MFDIGWQELFIIGVLALIVVGPKDLPRVLKTATTYIRKAKGLAREFQNGVNEVVREAELDDIRKQVDAQKWDVNKALENAIDKEGLEEQLNLDDGSAGLDLEKDYQERKREAEERARKQLADEEEENRSDPNLSVYRAPEDGPVSTEPQAHELDSDDADDEEPAPAEASAPAETPAPVPEKEPAKPGS